MKGDPLMVLIGALAMLIFVASLNIAYEVGYTAGRQEVPMAVVPRDSTVILVRTIKLPAPKPDTSLRYICKEAK